MLVRVSDSTLVPELVRALEDRAHYVVKQVHDDTIAVSVLGSFADRGEGDLTSFLVGWQEAHPGVDFDVSAG